MGRKAKTKIGAGKVGRFDQRNTMFSRPRDPEKSSPEILEMGKKHYGVHNFEDKEGYTMLDWASAMGSWYLERWWGFGNMVGNEGLYEWFPDQSKIAERDRIPPGQKRDVSDPGEMTRIVSLHIKYVPFNNEKIPLKFYLDAE